MTTFDHEIHRAVENEDVDALRQYIAEGGDIEILTSTMSLLKHALDIEICNAEAGDAWHIDMTALILAAGADPLLREETTGETAMDFAAERGHWLATRLFQTWVHRGEPKPPHPKRSLIDRMLSYHGPIHDAIASRDIDALRQVIDDGADVDRIAGGRSPLQHALDVERGAADRGHGLHVDMTALLLAAGADPSRRAGPHQQTPLQQAQRMSHWLAVAVLEGWVLTLEA